MKWIRTLLLLAAAMFFPSVLAAQDVIATQLEAARARMAAEGFAPTDDPVRGELASGEDEEFEVDLRAGVRYMIVAMCDGDCSDLDLVLTDAAGAEVAADRALDDVPMLSVEGRNGTFVVAVQMATCATATCDYGVRIFAMR